MAELYTTYTSIPVNRNARKALFRAARLGTRPAPPSSFSVGDAVEAVSVAAAYKDGWEGSSSNPALTVRAAWADRKNYP